METQTLTQTITILVDGGTSASGTGLAASGQPSSFLLVIALALIVASLLAWRFAAHRSYGTKLSFRSFSGFIFLSLSATGLTLNLTQASAAPTITLGTNQDNLAITVPQGGGTANATTTVTTGTVNDTGYELTAALLEAQPGISISLKGGDVTTGTPLSAGDSPLSLKTTNTVTTNDTTSVTLDFTIDSTVTSGTKELKFTYAAIDNAPPAPLTMQTMTSSYCQDHMTIYNGTNENAVLTLSDPRGGGQTYRVAKLADDNCWMLDNLKLGSTTAATVLTSADTNIASNFTLSRVPTTHWGSSDNPGVYGPVPGDTGSGATNYGYLYNWSAATAGESTTSHPANAGNAPYSICPTGWRLPTGGIGGEFKALDTALGSSVAQWQSNGPFKGTFAGNWSWGSFVQQGATAYIWSSSATPMANYIAHRMIFVSYTTSPESTDDRQIGSSVRCLLN